MNIPFNSNSFIHLISQIIRVKTMTKTIGLIGTGQVGSSIAQLIVGAGYNIVVSNSRGPESLKDLVSKLGPTASADTPQSIASNDDIKIIILSVPLAKVLPLLETLKFKNKVILDTTNYYPERDGNVEVLDSHKLTTSEYVLQGIDTSSNSVVKAFHNIDAIHLALNASKDSATQTTLPIAGDDLNAKKIATEFINSLGYKVLDAGSFKDSWRHEPGEPVYVLPYFPDLEGLDRQAAVQKFVTTPGTPLSSKDIQNLIDQATVLEKVGGSINHLGQVVIDLITQLQQQQAA